MSREERHDFPALSPKRLPFSVGVNVGPARQGGKHDALTGLKGFKRTCFIETLY